MARKYKSSRKYNYNGEAKSKKIILIVVAVLLVLAAAVAAILLLGGNDEATGNASFSLHSAPNKTTYYVGESPSWYGLEVKLITAEGSTIILGPESCTITGFDNSRPVENQVITVKYEQYTATFTVSIVERNHEQQKPENNGKLSGMSFKTMPKTEYKVAQWLSVEGGVLLLQYDDGTTKEINLTYDMVSGFNTSKPGKYTLTVSYREKGKTATLTYDITVTE